MERAREGVTFRMTAGIASGCYLLLLRGEVIYVGQSENLFHRLNVHWREFARRKKGKPPTYRSMLEGSIVEFDEVELIPVPLHELNHQENRLIRLYRPKLNVRLNRVEVPEGADQHPAFLDLLKKSQEPKFRKIGK